MKNKLERVRSFEALVVAMSLGALLILVLLRGFAETAPLILFLAALVLLISPGALMVRWFAADVFSGAAILPAAFALGVGMFGILGVPFLLLNLSLNLYLAFCGGVLAALLLAAVVVLARRPLETGEKDVASSDHTRWLWIPYLALVGILTHAATVARVDGDTWNYLSWVREYLNTDKLAFYDPYFATRAPEFSRVKINGWMLEQAGLARVSGIDPIPMAVNYLTPTLVAMSLLTIYALGRSIFESRGAALLAGIVFSLFMLAYLQASQFSIGGEFLSRAVQDKNVTRSIFLPIALCFAAAWLKKRRLAHLLIFGFLCWAVVSVHPAGLAVIGLATSGVGLVHVLAHPLSKESWGRAVALATALLSILVLPLLYMVATGKALSSALYSADISGSHPAVLANQVFIRDVWMRIRVLEDGLYIMHPFLVLNPVIITAFVLGIPFLVWRVRGSVAAQLLLGSLFTATVASYVPQVATFIGDKIVAPGQLYRLSWPILLAGPVVLGWIAWEAIHFVSEKLSFGPRGFFIANLAVVLLMAGIAAPSALAGLADAYGEGHQRGDSARSDPVFWWLHRNLEEPSVILATDPVNTALPAFSSNANVISLRGKPVLESLEELERVSGQRIEVPQGSIDVRDFFSGPTVSEAYDILRRNKVDYVLVGNDGPLANSMEDKVPFTLIGTPSKRYDLFAVDRKKLELAQ